MRKLIILFVMFIPSLAYSYDYYIGDIYYSSYYGSGDFEVTYFEWDEDEPYPYSYYSGSVNIPSRLWVNYSYHDVIAIDNFAFYNCSRLTSVTIPNSVTSIGNQAFKGCSGLTEVTIPNSVTSIGANAFYGCSGLTEVSIPNSVTSIGFGSFASCTKLTSIIVENGNSYYVAENGVLFNKNKTTILCYPAGKTQSTYIIPSNVTSIGRSAFIGCSKLTSVTIPESITSIGDYAFNSTSNLTSVTVEMKTPLTITENTFTNRANATLYVPAGCKAAYEAAQYWQDFNIVPLISFADANVKALCVQNWDTDGDGELSEAEAAAVTNLGTVFKGNTTITSFDELQYFTGLTSIGEYAFDSCSSLTSVSIPNSVISISRNAFSGCSGLTAVNIPNSVTSIGQSAFSNCSGLTSVNIPNSVTSIGDFAFHHCLALTSFTFPESLSCINNSLFWYCTSLASVIIPENITAIESLAFQDCTALTSITIPKSVTSIGDGIFAGCNSLATIVVDGDNPVYDSRENCNSIIETATNTLIQGCMNSVISENVTSVGKYAFLRFLSLSSITIPKSVAYMGDAAFQCTHYEGVSGLLSIKMNSAIPITIHEDCFNEPPYYFATLYVPKGSKAAYQAADYWKEFKHIEEYEVKDIVTFADANVKAICVQNWDTDGDGELSEDEAAAVTDLGAVFKGNTTITSFDELQYFTGLTSIKDGAFYGCSNLNSVIIPESVTSILDNAFRDCSGLTSINIPESVTSIGKWAFLGCSGLTSVIIPSSVTSISKSAFYGCTSLTSMTIPNSVTSIGEAAFSHCSSLTAITVENGNSYYVAENGVLFNKNKTSLLCFPAGKTQSTYAIPESVTRIFPYAFDNCRSLTAVTIPNSVTSIGNYAFYWCTGLTSVTIPSSVAVISDNMFQDCRNLTSVTIPNSVTSIGGHAFYRCLKLTSVTIPSSVTSIGNYAFQSCDNLTSVTVEMETPLTITELTFTNRSNATLYVPAGCKAAYEAAQYWQDFNIVSLITFADANVKAICVQNWDTDGDGELSEAEAAAVTDLGTVFKGNTTITSFDELQYFTGLTNIGDNAFRSCRALTSVTIPNSVTSIEQDAFHSCIGLTSVNIPESITDIRFAAFYQCHSLTSVTIPTSVKNIAGAAFGECSSLTSINVENGNNVYISEDGVLFNKNKNTIICYPAGKVQTDFTIPESVTSIFYGAFSGCSSLTSVSIPNSLTTIGKIAFQNCTGLTSVTIPNSVTDIGDGAFNGCSNLTSVTVEKETPLTIAENTFSNRANATLYVPAGCKAAYEAANYWKEFKEIVEYGGIEQTLALETLPSMTYGDDACTLPETTAEGLTLTWNSDNNAVATFSGNVLAINGAGTATITATQVGNDSYLPFNREFSLTVGKAVLTITANDCRKVEGEANPELTVSYEGFKYDDNASVLTQQPTVTTEATTDSPAGTYPITVSGAEAANYDISYVAGTLTVEEAKIEPTDISQLDNAIYVDPVETVSNSTYALNIKAKNNVTVAGMSFTLTLPDDFSLITDDGGIISTLDSQRASSSKFMVMSSQSGNSYLIRVLPISGTTISGTDGTVLTVRLKNTNAEEGTYELKVNNSSFTVKNADNTFETLPLVDVISTIEITGNLLGDVNGDGNVDLTDAIMIVNHSLDNTPSNFRIDVADVNGDGNIDLTDAIIVVNMSMDSSSMARQAFMMDLDPE